MTVQQFIEANRDGMIRDIADFVNIPTVFDETTAGPGQPFGTAVDEGLRWILEKAERMGMKVRNLQGYAGEITAGDGPFTIGILAHEDVVPAGEGWETNPFEAVVKDGKIFGRGSADDKGPLISCLYAMKYLNDANRIPQGSCLRMIVGTNEEESWGGIRYYTEHAEKLPDYSIVPDGYFPLIYCEKGLFDIDLQFETAVNEAADLVVECLTGGSGRNVVPGSGRCILRRRHGVSAEETAEKLNRCEHVEASVQGDRIYVSAQGKSTHAMSPEKGIHAVNYLIEALAGLDAALSIDDFIDAYHQAVGLTFNGEQMGLGFEDDLTGKLTFNIGVVRYEEGNRNVELEGNLRYPASMAKDEMWTALQAAASNAGFVCTEKEYLPPVYTKPDAPLVTRLMDVYREVSGDRQSEAFTIGGATYARAIPNAVAFGPLFPYEEELAHEANEFLLIDSLEKMTAIYANALASLLQMK